MVLLTSDLVKPLCVYVVNAAVAYDCKFIEENYILVIYNDLHMKLMEVNLIPPFMLRLAGLDVNECPKLLTNKTILEHHSVFFPKDDIRLTFKIEGIVSYLPTRPPDISEMSNCKHLVLTPESQSWDPHTFIYWDQDNSMLKYRGEVKEKPNQDHRILAA